MRRKLGVALACAALAIGLYWLWPRGGRSAQSSGEAGSGGAAANSRSTAQLRAERREDRTPASLSGRVLDRERKTGIPGALVAVTENSLDGGATSGPGRSAEAPVVQTDEAGRWSLAGVAPGRYTITATARGFAPASVHDILVRPGEDRDDVDLWMTAGGYPLTGVVSDIGGGPIPDAIVRARPLTGVRLFDIPFTAYAARTDAEGRYELNLANGNYALTAEHVDYVTGQRGTTIRSGARREDFSLVPGATIHGQVVTRADGSPVPDALVYASPGGFLVAGFAPNGVSTDAEGRFVLRRLSSGAVQLRATARGYATPEATSVELGIGEQVTGVVLTVDRAFTVSGVVVRQEDRDRVLGGVLVGAYNLRPGAALVASRPSAEDGYFEILGVPAGSYSVGAAGQDRVPNVVATQISVENADITDLVVPVESGVTLSGRVEPGMAAEIRAEIDVESIGLFNWMNLVKQAVLAAQADADGNFELKAVSPGALKLTATTDDGKRGRLEVEVGNEDISGLVIRMTGGPSVSGRVVDGAGNAVPGVQVSVRSDKPRTSFTTLNFGAGNPGVGVGASSPTDEQGRFAVVGLEPGQHFVSVRDDQGLRAWADAEHASAPRAPIDIDVGDAGVSGLTLTIETRSGVIRGRVTAPGGEPVADAWVTARRDTPDFARMGRRGLRVRVGGSRDRAQAGGGSSSESDDSESAKASEEEAAKLRASAGDWSRSEQPVLTDEEGRFEIRDLREGKYDLSAEGLKGGARGKLEDVELGANVVIHLEALAGIAGTVTRAGQPVTDYMLTLSGATFRRQHVADPAGRYEVRRLEPGEYTVSITSEHGSASGSVEVKANAMADLNLTLIAYASVSGRVVSEATGEPMEGLTAFVTTEGPSDFESVAMELLTDQAPKTGEDGHFHVARLAAGRGTLLIMDGALAGFQLVATQEVALRAGEDLDVGEVRGLAAAHVPREERGVLGLVTEVALWADRPLAPDEEREGEPPAGLAADSQQLWVRAVTEGRPAAEAGLLPGDRIVSANGVPVEAVGPTVINQVVSSQRVRIGDQLRLEIDRRGDRKSFELTAVAP